MCFAFFYFHSDLMSHDRLRCVIPEKKNTCERPPLKSLNLYHVIFQNRKFQEKDLRKPTHDSLTENRVCNIVLQFSHEGYINQLPNMLCLSAFWYKNRSDSW